MAAAQPGVGEAAAEVAESVARLLAQHVKLLRAEAETLARSLAREARDDVLAVAVAVPFCLVGLFLLSLGLAQWLGVAFQPAWGDRAVPICTLVVGLLEIGAAGLWARARLARLPRQTRAIAAGLTEAFDHPSQMTGIAVHERHLAGEPPLRSRAATKEHHA